MPIPNGKYNSQITSMCAEPDCGWAGEQKFERLRDDLPLYVVRSGRDNVPLINESIDHLAQEAPARGVQLTLVQYPEGRHAFYLDQDTERSREIIAETLEFFKTHLLAD